MLAAGELWMSLSSCRHVHKRWKLGRLTVPHLAVWSLAPLTQVAQHLGTVSRGRAYGSLTIAPRRHIVEHISPTRRLLQPRLSRFCIVSWSATESVWIRIELSFWTPRHLVIFRHSRFGADENGAISIRERHHHQFRHVTETCV